MNFKGLTFGVPKEILADEKRVAAIPDTVKKLTSENATVLIEKGAGIGSYFSDDEYRTAGAEIIENVEDIFKRADILLKVKEPHFNEEIGKHEVDMMKEGQYLISFIHPANPGNHSMVKALADKGVITLTLDSIPRISRAQSMDALTSMSIVAGYKGVLMAAHKLPRFMPIMGTASGVLQPSNVLVIGAGVAGLQAIATAKSLGAVVYGFDIRHDACQQIKSLGARLIEFNVPQELAVGEGGYAKKLPDEWLNKEREILHDHVKKADIIILSALIPGKLAPILVTDEMVQSMKSGSVIVDIAVDQGGNCAVTEAGKIKEKYNVNIMGIQNIPGTVPMSSTWMFANNIYNFVKNLIQEGTLSFDMEDEIIAHCLVTRGGKIVHVGAREAMGI